MAFIGVMFITPDSLFIRLSNIETWGMLFYRGAIPFLVVLFGLIIFYKKNFFNALFKIGYPGLFYVISFSICNITFIISIQNTNVANTLLMNIFYDSLSLGNFYGDLFGLITAFGLACNANLARYAKSTDLVPSAVIGKLCVAIFAFFFVKDFALVGTDMIFIPIMCVMCVAIPFVLVTIAPRFITAAEVNLFFLLETIIGPIWVWLIIKEQPSTQTILGGIVIIITIAIHSLLAIKKTQTKTT